MGSPENRPDALTRMGKIALCAGHSTAVRRNVSVGGGRRYRAQQSGRAGRSEPFRRTRSMSELVPFYNGSIVKVHDVLKQWTLEPFA